MNRVPNRALVVVARLGIALASGALVAACSAIVSPDTDRLRPPGADSGLLDSGLVDSGTVDSGTTDGGDRDGGPLCPVGCDDSVECTVDACGATGCTHSADDGACSDGERCNEVMGCVPLRCTTSAECDDGSVCNGAEVCDPASSEPSGCVAGTAMICNDGRSCTNDLCVDATGGCVFMARNAMCDDDVTCTTDTCDPAGTTASDGCTHATDDALCNDGFCFTGGRCNAMTGCVGSAPRDCDDGDPCDVEMCDAAGSVCISDPLDVDMDGFAPIRVVGATCAGGTDCDDARADVHPGATETCANGRDDDCNGMIDDGCVVTTPADTCATALSLTSLPPVSSGSTPSMPTFPYGGTRTGTFSTFADDARACGNSGGRDAFFTFETAGIVDVIIDTRPSSGSSLDTVLTVLDSCGTAPLACNDDQDPGNGVGSRIFMHRVGTASASNPWARRTYYVYVDGYDAGVTGGFTVNVQVRRAAPDSCASEPLDINGGGTVYGVGNLGFGGSVTASGTCGGGSASEAILRTRRPTDGEHHALAVTSSTFSPVLYMRLWTCSSGTELDCDASGGTITASGIGTGETTQHIFIDGMTGTTPHTYTLTYDP